MHAFSKKIKMKDKEEKQETETILRRENYGMSKFIM